MNKYSMLLISCGLVLAAFFRSALAQQPESYLLTCRPGANQIQIDNRVDQKKGQAPVTSAHIRFMFSSSRGSASAGLSPGQCAWVDRAVASDEPKGLELNFSDARLIPQITQVDRGYAVQFSVRGRGQTRSAGEEELARFIGAFQRGEEFQVRAYNDKKGSLVATRFGP